MRVCGNQLDSLGFDDTFHERVDTLIECGNETQSKFRHTSIILVSGKISHVVDMTWTFRLLFRPLRQTQELMHEESFPILLRYHESRVSFANNSSTVILRGVSHCSCE